MASFKRPGIRIVDGNNALIVDRQCRAGQVISPGSQQIILVLLVIYRYPSGAYTYISADQATISAGTGVGISHDQHIPRFFSNDENRNARPVSEIPTFYSLGMCRVADCDIGVTRPFTFEIISFRN